MKIKKYKFQLARLNLKEPFKTALGLTYVRESLILTIFTDQHITGIGEAAPTATITGETISGCISALIGHLLPALKNQDISDLERVHFLMDKAILRNTSAKAAVDMAIYDALSKEKGVSLAHYLSAKKNTISTDITIGIRPAREMAKKAIEYVQQGFKAIKLKVGLGYKEDISRVKAVREAIGDKIKIRVDFNQGMENLNEAARIITAMEKYNLELVEQPLKWFDLNKMAQLKRLVSTPIAADESAHSLVDAERIINSRAADIINIKLMKSGGIYPAIEIINKARKFKMPCMIGGMIESKIAVAAAVCVGVSCSGIKYADLDADLLLKEDYISGGADIVNGTRIITKKPGLGIKLARLKDSTNFETLLQRNL